MQMPQLKTTNPEVILVEPNVERDSVLGLEWLSGQSGRETLSLMGVNDDDNKPSTIDAERHRVQDFIDSPEHLNWMIQWRNKVVGAVWVDLQPTANLLAPSVHIMIGDPMMRSKGVGTAAFATVVDYLEERYPNIYSRYVITNGGSHRLLEKLQFKPMGSQYADADGLIWQNVQRLSSHSVRR